VIMTRDSLVEILMDAVSDKLIVGFSAEWIFFISAC